MDPLFQSEQDYTEFHTSNDVYLRILEIPIVADYRKLEGVTRHKYRTIYQMLRVWGLRPGHQCRECRHLVYKEGDFQGKFLKCET